MIIRLSKKFNQGGHMCSTATEKHSEKVVHILDASSERDKGYYKCTYCGGILIPKFPTGEDHTKSKDVRLFSLEEVKAAIEYAKNNKKEKEEKSRAFTPHFAHSPEERDIWALCPEANDNPDRNLDFTYKHICDLNVNDKYLVRQAKYDDLEYIEIAPKSEEHPKIFITTHRPTRFPSSMFWGRIITVRKWMKWKGYGLIMDSSERSIGAIWAGNDDHKRIAYSYKKQKKSLELDGYILEFCLRDKGFIITAPNKTISENGVHVKCDYVTSYVSLDQVMSGQRLTFPETIKERHPDEVKRLKTEIEHTIQMETNIIESYLAERDRILETLKECIRMINQEKTEVDLEFKTKSDRSKSPEHQVLVDLQNTIDSKRAEMIDNWMANEELNKMLGIKPEDNSFIPGEKNQLAIEIDELQTELNHLTKGETKYIRALKKKRASAIEDANNRIKHLETETDVSVQRIKEAIELHKQKIETQQNKLRELEQ